MLVQNGLRPQVVYLDTLKTQFLAEKSTGLNNSMSKMITQKRYGPISQHFQEYKN